VPDEPLISCLCVTRNRVAMLRRAVSCFLKQTYQPRELVVLYEADDPATRDYLATLSEPSIRPVEVPASPRLRLGSLRNLSLEASRGHFVAQWDDDDWHGPTRLTDQLRALRSSGKPGCVLSRWVIYDLVTNTAFLSTKRAWEGSLVAERSAVPPYLDLGQGEDTPVISRMVAENKLVLLDRPHLYVYFYHGGNTCERVHWERLFSRAEPLAQEDAERMRSLLAPDGGPIIAGPIGKTATISKDRPSTIPKLIHQLWKTAALPAHWEDLTRRWKELHPDWSYKLWTDDDCREFVRTVYPKFHPVYQAFPFEIQRIDAVRYLILHTYGGVYLDLDMFPFKNLDVLTTSTDFIAGSEPPAAATCHIRELIVSNAFMASPPKHPFLGHLIKDMGTYKSPVQDRSTRILETTGPLFMSRVYGAHPTGVQVLHYRYFMPLFYEEVDALVSQRNGAGFYNACHDAYGAHLFEGTWWRNTGSPRYIEALRMPAGPSKIPRIIHVTWRSKELPQRFVPIVDRMRALHPGWEIRLWTDDEMLAFVTEHGPQYLAKYTGYKHMIQRCDFFRLFVVSVLGGVYLDLDVELAKSFNELPGYVEAFFPCEKVMSKRVLALHGNRDAVRIGNYAFGAVPNHPFLLYLLGRLKDVERVEKEGTGKDPNYVLETTGPGILTTAYHDYVRLHPDTNVTILYPEIGAPCACGCLAYAGVASCKVGSFGTHLHVGSWR
jgi:mannosyltransferase OCH1-like enzyme